MNRRKSERNQSITPPLFKQCAMTRCSAQLSSPILRTHKSTKANTGRPWHAIKPDEQSFASIKQIDAGLLNVGYAPKLARRWSWRPIFSMAGPTTSTACRRHTGACSGGLPPSSSPICAAMGTTAFSPAHHAQRPTVGRWPRHHRSHGCTQNSESHRRRL